MTSGPITLYDQRRLELQLEGGGTLALEYCCEEEAPVEPDAPNEKMGHPMLEKLKDLARKYMLRDFVEVYLVEDDVRWEFVCRGNTLPEEQALAVFTIHNRQGEEGLKRLHSKIKAFQRQSARQLWLLDG